jgi:hypothetical protein
LGRRIAGMNPAGGSDDEVCVAMVAFAELASLASAGLAHMAAEADIRGVCDREYGLSTASWLARETGLPTVVARSHVKVGSVLATRLGEVDAAVVDRAITSHHAKVLADVCSPRVTDAVAGMQPELIALAQGCSFERWRAEVRGIVELLDQDGGHDPNQDLASNTLSVADTIDGVTHLAGRLVGEHALGVTAAIDAKADELFRRFSTDRDQCPDIVVPPRATLRALALAELCRDGQATDVGSSRPPRPEITLVVQADEPDTTTSPTGARLADGTTRTLRCDADLYAVVVDSLGVPLDLGHAIRSANLAQRRAMAVRDGGCVFPGCTLPPQWCDAHHLDLYRNGGRTDVTRMASLCRHHHGVTHRTGWHMHATDDGWYHWQTPTGRTFWSQRHGRTRPGPAPPPTTPDPPARLDPIPQLAHQLPRSARRSRRGPVQTEGQRDDDLHHR